MPRASGFRNVDLEVGARSLVVIAPLVDALSARLVVLFRGRIRGLYRAHFESMSQHRDASATICALAATIESLDGRARQAWEAAALRDFNVGVELAAKARSAELAIEAEAVRRVAELGGRIAWTAYSPPTSSSRSRRRP